MKEARHKDHIRFHFYEMSQIGKSVETESGLVVSREQGDGGTGSDCGHVPSPLLG